MCAADRSLPAGFNRKSVELREVQGPGVPPPFAFNNLSDHDTSFPFRPAVFLLASALLGHYFPQENVCMKDSGFGLPVGMVAAVTYLTGIDALQSSDYSPRDSDYSPN